MVVDERQRARGRVAEVVRHRSTLVTPEIRSSPAVAGAVDIARAAMVAVGAWRMVRAPMELTQAAQVTPAKGERRGSVAPPD